MNPIVEYYYKYNISSNEKPLVLRVENNLVQNILSSLRRIVYAIGIYQVYNIIRNIQLTHSPPAAVINIPPCRNVWSNGESVAHGAPKIGNQQHFPVRAGLVLDAYQTRYPQVSF